MERAEAFGLYATEYERGRPGYPAAAVRWLLGTDPLVVADLGAGTGKLTAALVAQGHRVPAVEPLSEMRVVLADRAPEAQLIDGTAEQTGLPGQCVDAVVAGSAFHWFDRSRVFPEIERILRPPGILGLLGNGFDTSRPWVAELREILGGSRLGRAGHWPDVAELLGRFTDVDEQSDQREARLGQVSQLWEVDPELHGRASAILRYLTRVRRCRGLRTERRV